MSSHSLQEVPSGDWSDAVPVAESVRAASIRDDTDSVIDFGARKHVVQGEEGLTSYNGEFWDPESQPPELPIEAEMSEDISVEPSRSTPLTGLAVLDESSASANPIRENAAANATSALPDSAISAEAHVRRSPSPPSLSGVNAAAHSETRATNMDDTDDMDERDTPSKRRKLGSEDSAPTSIQINVPHHHAPAPRPRKPKSQVERRGRISSARAAMHLLENARYNEKGEIIESSEEGETPPPATPAEPTVVAIPSGGNVVPSADTMIGVLAPSAVSLAGISRAEARLMAATYNERGEMVEKPPPTIATPSRKQFKHTKKTATTNMDMASGSGHVSLLDLEHGPDGKYEASPTQAKAKAKSKAKSKVAAAAAALLAEASDDVASVEAQPPAKRSKKKSKPADDAATTERSGSVFTATESRQETPIPPPKKPSKTTAANSSPGNDRSVEDDHKLYCICKKPYNDDTDDVMLECDRCFNWYHLGCVGVPEEDVELLDTYICAECEKDTNVRTTWKTKCKRDQCRKGRDEPLSKYCSEACGIHHMLAVISAKGYDHDLVWPAVQSALPPQGYAMINEDEADRSSAKRSTAGARTYRLTALQRDLGIYQHRLNGLDQRLASIERDSQRLEAAVATYESLPPIPRVVDTQTSSKKSTKSKKGKNAGAAGPAMDKLCAFDARLIDAEESGPEEGDFNMEGISVEDIPEYLCQTVERKCRRHVDWRAARQADIQLQMSLLTAQKQDVERLLGKCREKLAEIAMLMPMQPELSLDLGEVKMALD